MRMPHKPLQSTYQREEVQALIAQSSPRIQLLEHGNARSDIWRHFRRVYLDGLLQPYVRCNYCTGLIISRHGTSSLLRHNCQTLAQIKQQTDQTADAPPDGAGGGDDDDGGAVAGLDVAELEQRQQLEELAQYHSQAERHHGHHQEAPLALPLAGRGLVTKFEVDDESNCSTPLIDYHATMEVTEEDNKNILYTSTSNDSSASFFNNRYDTKQLATATTTSSVPAATASISNGTSTTSSMLQLRVATYQVSLVVEDLLPVNIMEKPGFQKLAQALIDVGAEHGRLSLSDVLVPSGSLATHHLPSLCRLVRHRLIPKVLSNDLAFTLDCWTAEGGHRQHLTIIANYVDDSFLLHSTVLGTRELFPVALSVHHNAADVTVPVMNAAIEIIAQYTGNADEAKRKLRSSVVVCEEQLDKSVLPSSHRCACSLLTAILNDILSVDGDSPLAIGNQNNHVNGGFVEYHQVAQEALRVMAELRRRESELRPKQPLPVPHSKNWTHIFEVLRSLLDNLDNIQKLADRDVEHGAGGLISTTLTRSVLTPLVNFLQLFRCCLDSLCADVPYVTINLCVLWKLKLENHCEVDGGADTILREVRIAILDRLRSDFTFGRGHHVALLLDPNFKSLKMLSAELRANTMEHAAELMREADLTRETVVTKPEVRVYNASGGQQQENKDGSSPPAYKRSKILMNFTEFLDAKTESGVPPRDRVEAELQRYVASTIDYTEEGTDILHFWKTGGGEFPALQKVARRILAPPACSAAARYPLATKTRQRAGKRARLNNNIDELLLLHGTLA